MDDKIREILQQFSLSNYSYCKTFEAAQWGIALANEFSSYTGKHDSSLTHATKLKMLYVKDPEGNPKLEQTLKKEVEKFNLISMYQAPITTVKRHDSDLIERQAKKHNIEVSINLSFPDNLLIEDLQKYIQEARLKLNIQPISSLKKAGKQYTKAEMQAWHGHGVLPFIDLTIWLKKNNMKLSLQEIGVVIFRVPYTSYEKKISRLKKEVDGLMTAEQIHLLLFMN